jgi:two-component system sensor histidine kinase QseC
VRLKPLLSGDVRIEIENQLTTSLSDSELENLTMPLFQLEKSRTNPDRHGLGLSIVDKIAKANNMDFSFKKNTDLSIVFSIVLPRGDVTN